MMFRIKFEHVFAVVLVIVLSGALWLFKADKDITVPILTAFIGALGGVTGYFFTKHNPNK